MYQKSVDEMSVDARSLAPELLKASNELSNGNSQDAMLVKAIEMSASEFHNREFIDWRRARAIIEHENILVNHRVTWLLLSQAALLAAFASLYAKAFVVSVPVIEKGIAAIPLLFIILLGSLICVNLYWSLKNASTQISRVTKWWYKEVFNDDTQLDINDEAYKKTIEAYNILNLRHPPLHYWREIELKVGGSKVGNWFVFRTEALPWYFVSLWVMLLVGGIIKNALPEQWKQIGNFMAQYGIQWGGGAVLCIIGGLAGFSYARITASPRKSRNR